MLHGMLHQVLEFLAEKVQAEPKLIHRYEDKIREYLNVDAPGAEYLPSDLPEGLFEESRASN
eukprot:4356633-Pyramimonas_sp.AAC.1